MKFLERLGAEEAYIHHNKAFGMVDELQGRLSRATSEVINPKMVIDELEEIINVMKESHKWIQALKE